MDYGFPPNTQGYKKNYEYQLAKELNLLLKKYNHLPEVKRPYIEVNGLYKGVRIRKITYLSSWERNKLVRQAEKIYKKIMLKNK